MIIEKRFPKIGRPRKERTPARVRYNRWYEDNHVKKCKEVRARQKEIKMKLSKIDVGMSQYLHNIYQGLKDKKLKQYRLENWMSRLDFVIEASEDPIFLDLWNIWVSKGQPEDGSKPWLVMERFDLGIQTGKYHWVPRSFANNRGFRWNPEKEQKKAIKKAEEDAIWKPIEDEVIRQRAEIDARLQKAMNQPKPPKKRPV